MDVVALQAAKLDASRRYGRKFQRRDFPGYANIPTVMSSPPTRTLSAANAASTITSGVTFDGFQPGCWTYYGITPGNVSGWTAAINQYNSYTTAPPWAVETVLDTVLGVFEVRLHGSNNTARLWVNGQPADQFATWTTPNDGAAYRGIVTLGAGGVYRIRVEFAGSQRFGGFTIGPTDSLSPSVRRGPRCVIIGDSFTEPTIIDSGSKFDWYGWGQQLSYLTGWDVWAAGAGGTGYLNPNSGAGRVKFGDRLANVLAFAKPDIVIFAGGINDYSYGSYTYAAMNSAALACFQAARAYCPGPDQLIVLSPFWRNGFTTYPGGLLDAKDAVFAAAAQVNAIQIDLMCQPVSNPITGTLTSTYSSGVTNLAGTANIPAGSYVRYGTGASSEILKVNSVGGTGPYTINTTTTSKSAHSSGDPVVQVGPPIWTGTGKQTATVGDGTADRYTGSDGTHPTVLGHGFLAREIAQYLGVGYAA